MKPAKDFLIHVELHGLLSLYVYPSPTGSRIDFFPYPALEKDFPTYLVEKFGHLGQPSDCVLDQDSKRYAVEFPGLRFTSQAEALEVVTRGLRSSRTSPSRA